MSGVDRSYSQIKTFRGRKALWLSFVVVGVVVVGVIVGIRKVREGLGRPVRDGFGLGFCGMSKESQK